MEEHTFICTINNGTQEYTIEKVVNKAKDTMYVAKLSDETNFEEYSCYEPELGKMLALIATKNSL